MKNFNKPNKPQNTDWVLSLDEFFRSPDEATEVAIFRTPAIPDAEQETGPLHLDNLNGQVVMVHTSEHSDYSWSHQELLKVEQKFLIRETVYNESPMSSFDYDSRSVSTRLYQIPTIVGLFLEDLDSLILPTIFQRYVTYQTPSRRSWRELSMAVTV